jgi:hypothetical protein
MEVDVRVVSKWFLKLDKSSPFLGRAINIFFISIRIQIEGNFLPPLASKIIDLNHDTFNILSPPPLSTDSFDSVMLERQRQQGEQLTQTRSLRELLTVRSSRLSNSDKNLSDRELLNRPGFGVRFSRNASF